MEWIYENLLLLIILVISGLDLLFTLAISHLIVKFLQGNQTPVDLSITTNEVEENFDEEVAMGNAPPNSDGTERTVSGNWDGVPRS